MAADKMKTAYKNEIIDFIKIACSKSCNPSFSKILNGVPADVFIAEFKYAILFHDIDRSENDPFRSLKKLVYLGQNLQVVHIWEDQWIFHCEKVKSRILSLFGQTMRIHGRLTKLIQLNNDEIKSFLSANHLHVPIKAQYKYGLEKDGEIVAVMSFSKGRKIMRNNEVYNSFELLRFCNKLNTTVVGGFSKLLKHFIKLHHPDDIMTYADADWSDGMVYTNNKFELKGEISEMEFWLNLKSGEREYPQMVIKKHEIPKDLNKSDLEKNDFLQNNGYKRVYNSGSYKYILLCKKSC